MNHFKDPMLDLETRLNGQTGRIGWHELQRYFARGVVREVAQGIDLIDAGKAIIDNDTSTVEAWIAQDKLRVPDDTQAQQWFDENAEVWALVIAPWVLIQLP
ncbi:DUF2288 domain-containing protein [Litorivivens sp.]|uniref:DUF2288 domain-containing protein n=1 Tax=Litorivivens sp. TaxID=2020868 RepID=UPI00356531D5